MPRAPKNEDETPAENGEETTTDENKESPEDRFKRVAGKRVMTALRALDTVIAAGKSVIMKNDDEQREKIVSALTVKVEEVNAALQTDKSGKKEKVETFDL